MIPVAKGVRHRAALALMDSLAEFVVGHSAPVRLDLARSESDREAVYRLRSQVVLALGWTGLEGSSDGIERDGCDDDAVHIVAWSGADLAATARLVFPREGLLLPTEAAFKIEVAPRGQVADWGRMAVAPKYQGPGHRVLWGLLAESWLVMRMHGYSQLCGILDSKMIGLYHRMGLEFEVLAPAQWYWNEERYSCRFDVAASAPGVAQHASAQATTGIS